MKLNLWRLTQIFNVFLIVVFAALCVCFIPNFAAYMEDFLSSSGLTVPSRAVIWVFGALIASPCIVLLVMSLSLSTAIRNDSVFTSKTAGTLSAVSYIMLLDCVSFLVGVIVLFCLGETTFSPLFAIIDLIGFALSVLLRVLSDYIRRAAELKEEVDATL